MREQAQGEGFDIAEVSAKRPVEALQPSFGLALAPVVLVVVVNFLFVQFVVTNLDTTYLSEERFGGTTIEAVRGIWSIIVALAAAIIFIVVTSFGRFLDLRESLNKGADASVLPIFNTASLVGFGAVIAALPAFDYFTQFVLAIGSDNPLVSLAIAVNLLAAMTGSASGGMSIALDALSDTYVRLAADTGTSLEAMHRVTAVASGALDALPHNGAVITVLGICKLSHGDSYFDIFMVAIVGPMAALVVLLVLASFFGVF